MVIDTGSHRKRESEECGRMVYEASDSARLHCGQGLSSNLTALAYLKQVLVGWKRLECNHMNFYRDTQPASEYWKPSYGGESEYHRVGQLNKERIRKHLFSIQDGKCAITGLPLSDNFDIDHIIPFNDAKSSGHFVWERGKRKWRWVLYMSDGRRWNDISNLRLVLTVVHKKKSNEEISRVQMQMVRDGTHTMGSHNYTKESYDLTRSIHETFASGSMSQRSVAKTLGCSHTTVRRALERDLADYAQKCGVGPSSQVHAGM